MKILQKFLAFSVLLNFTPGGIKPKIWKKTHPIWKINLDCVRSKCIMYSWIYRFYNIIIIEGLFSQSFGLLLHPQKNVLNHYPKHLFFWWIVLRIMIWHIFLRIIFFLRLDHLYHDWITVIFHFSSDSYPSKLNYKR